MEGRTDETGPPTVSEGNWLENEGVSSIISHTITTSSTFFGDITALSAGLGAFTLKVGRELSRRRSLTLTAFTSFLNLAPLMPSLIWRKTSRNFSLGLNPLFPAEYVNASFLLPTGV